MNGAEYFHNVFLRTNDETAQFHRNPNSQQQGISRTRKTRHRSFPICAKSVNTPIAALAVSFEAPSSYSILGATPEFCERLVGKGPCLRGLQKRRGSRSLFLQAGCYLPIAKYLRLAKMEEQGTVHVLRADSGRHPDADVALLG